MKNTPRTLGVKILRLLPQVLILFLVKNWIPSSRSEIAEIGKKNRRNFRG
jgi:hypothetical protein